VTVTAEPRSQGIAGGPDAFVRGMVAELRAAGFEPPPVELRVDSTLPEGAGLSSSAALEAALCLALIGAAGLEPPADRLELARLCSRVERRAVGAHTGLLDQIASLLGEEGHALRTDFRTLDVLSVPLALGGWRLVAAPSGERHSLAAGSGYEARRGECGRAAELLGLKSLRDATPEAAASLPAPHDRRVRHVLEENERVEATTAALGRSDLAEVGRLLDASHASLRDLYEVSTDAVERTRARLIDAGAAGARIMGGGFGGSVIALFPPGREPPGDAPRAPALAGRARWALGFRPHGEVTHSGALCSCRGRRRVCGRPIEGRRPGQGAARRRAGGQGPRRSRSPDLHDGISPGVHGNAEGQGHQMTLARVPVPQETATLVHHRRGFGRWRGPITGVLAGLVVVLAGLGGYALGHSGRHTKKEATAARRAAEQRAYLVARQEIAARGRSAGIRAARAAATGGHRPHRAPAKPRTKPAPTPTGGVKDCKTFFGKKRFVSSVRNITCGAAAAEEGKALRAGHPTKTAGGFTCQQIDPQHYRCTNGSRAYRWDISP
jgi:galactokinase